MEKRNVAIIGHTDQGAINFIAEMQKHVTILNLIKETVGDIGHLESSTLQVGVNGIRLTVYPEININILLKYKNLVIVDFTQNKQYLSFYEKNNIKKIMVSDDMSYRDILDLIFLLPY